MYGQKMINGTCPDCKSKLPELKDDGTWDIVDCPNKDCNNWFDMFRYKRAGGKIV